ncbi:MAG: hypothetical protein JO307_24320 [Bryobacterales bacterium]|nr:hypothetical protein [Bryobacterales bacterium]MBV9399092.1 hypothetical protein [Bryobacterales bacterium]
MQAEESPETGGNLDVAPELHLKGATAPMIVAYRIPGHRRYPAIVPAAANREWMDMETGGWANRCLPLRISNQAGWFLLNDAEFDVAWAGKSSLESLRIFPADPNNRPAFASSMFGHGIVTFTVPYLFRTPPGYDLIVRGPTNIFKDGISPLDGIVESDWTPYTFTMNWKLTRRLKTVTFKRDEPFCMILPIPRHDLGAFEGEIRNLQSAPELQKGYQEWHEHRVAIVREQKSKTPGGPRRPVQGHYIRGQGYFGEKGEGHQTKVFTKNFVEIEPPVELPPHRGASPASTTPTKRRGWLRQLFRS